MYQLHLSEGMHCKGDVCLKSETSSQLIPTEEFSSGNLYIKNKPVCDDYWDMQDAQVACKGMGYAFASMATTHSK